MSRINALVPATFAVLLVACAGAPVATSSPRASAAPPTPPPLTPSPLPAVTPAPSPSSVATPSPIASAYPEGSVIVTFDVQGEEYKILLTSAPNIEIAEQLLAGEEAPSIPNGLIVRDDSGVNAPWSWHIDPASLEFADVTMEVCDGLPSHVEDGTLAGDRFCPWSAEVVAVEPANP